MKRFASSLILFLVLASPSLDYSYLFGRSVKTATFKAYCKQVYFAPSIDSDGDIEWFFTSYDESSNVPPPYDGNGLVNGELKQQSPNSSVFLMDWISPSYVEQYVYGNSLSWAFDNPDNYGSVSLNLSNRDVDGNGVVDWMQKDMPANEKFSGQLVVHTMSNATASITGSLYRDSGSGSGRYTFTYSVPGESGTSWGDWIVGYYDGSFAYDGNNCQIDATTMDAQGNIRTVSGSTTYSSSNENQVSIDTLDLKVNSSVVRINGKSLTRSGNVYSALVKAVDGGTASSWPDFQDWYLELTDPNDSDGDGVPDLSDSESSTANLLATSGNELVGGWRTLEWFGPFYPTNSDWIYHLNHGWIYIVAETMDSIWYWHETHKWCWTNQTIYPWVYSHAESSWWYMKAGTDGKFYAWKQGDQKWYSFDEASQTWTVLPGQESEENKAGDTFTIPDLSLEMLWVEPGTFNMGTSDSEAEIYWIGNSAETQHQVTLTQGFYLGKYEVTQAQYEAVMTGNTNGLSATPSYLLNNPNRPVEQVSHDDVQFFLTRLNDQKASNIPAGWAYVLPTEAEWEYACRAGTTTAHSWGDTISSTNANYSSSGIGQTHDVGQYSANPWGFHDMHGNVWEWTADWYSPYSSNAQTDPTGPASGTYKSLRGGAFDNVDRVQRSAFRSDDTPPSYRHVTTGFRIGFKASQ